MADDRNQDHLTETEVAVILTLLEKVDAVVVGGQALAIWSRLFLKKKPLIASFYSISSEDLDVFGNQKSATIFATSLDDSEVHIPKIFDDNSPNAAVVIGKIGERRVRIDFMRKILGVDNKSIQDKFITLSRSLSDGTSLNIIILHPLDCLRSRISNINDLHRHDLHSVSSAKAAMLVLEAFIDEHLENGELQDAQEILMSLKFLARDKCFGRAAHMQFGIDPRLILQTFRLDTRLDSRWRSHQLASAIKWLNKKADAAAKRQAATASALKAAQQAQVSETK